MKNEKSGAEKYVDDMDGAMKLAVLLLGLATVVTIVAVPWLLLVAVAWTVLNHPVVTGVVLVGLVLWARRLGRPAPEETWGINALAQQYWMCDRCGTLNIAPAPVAVVLDCEGCKRQGIAVWLKQPGQPSELMGVEDMP